MSESHQIGADDSPSQYSFSLATIFFSITIISVLLGIFVWMPGIGVILTLMSLPAARRTRHLVNQRNLVGLPARPGQVTRWFVYSGGVAIGVMISAVACLGSFLVFIVAVLELIAGSEGSAAAWNFILGSLVAGLLAGRALVVLWRAYYRLDPEIVAEAERQATNARQRACG